MLSSIHHGGLNYDLLQANHVKDHMTEVFFVSYNFDNDGGEKLVKFSLVCSQTHELVLLKKRFMVGCEI